MIFDLLSINQRIYKLFIYLLFMPDNKIQMPSSGGGLVRYFDDIKTKIEIKPVYVIVVIVLIIIIELYLYKFV